MKFKMNRKYICLTAVALLAVISISVGSAMAYFSTYVVSKGSQKVELDFSRTEIKETVEPGLKKITVRNAGKTECFVRVRVISGAEHKDKWSVDLKNSSTWKDGNDGFYYYFVDGSEKLLKPDDVTSVLKIAIKDFTKEFNVVVIQENTPALYDENGAAYSDWDRSELKVTNEYDVPVSVKK